MSKRSIQVADYWIAIEDIVYLHFLGYVTGDDKPTTVIGLASGEQVQFLGTPEEIMRLMGIGVAIGAISEQEAK